MTISKKLRDEIDAVCPPDDRPRRVLRAPVVLEDDDEGEEIPPQPIRSAFARADGPTIRDRVLEVLRAHSPLSQREVFARVARVARNAQSVRSQVSHELRVLELYGHAKRCRPPKDVDQQQAWWEVVE